uniref:hypothetical protein n=1 Tax=Ornithobacterium rhinotracheale TaxID=28251 RepID=UPI0039A6D588
MNLVIKIIIALLFTLALHLWLSHSLGILIEEWLKMQFFWLMLLVPFQMGGLMLLRRKSDFVGFYFMAVLFVIILFAKIMLGDFFNELKYSDLQWNVLVGSFFIYLFFSVFFMAKKLNGENFNGKKD